MAEQDRTRWMKLVADFESSVLTQREFAKERGVSLSHLRYWIHRLLQGDPPARQEPGKSSDQAPAEGATPKDSRLLPVRVVASAAKPQTAVVVRGAPDELLELALPSGVRIRFPAGTELKYLRALVAAL